MKKENKVQEILNIVKLAFDKHIEAEGFLDNCRDPQAYLIGEESFFAELYTELTKREDKV